MREVPETKKVNQMRRSSNIVLCVVAILLLEILIQQKAMAGEAGGRYYSTRAYSVLSANVGNMSPIKELIEGTGSRYKLLYGSREEKRVCEGIKRLEPDILILLETASSGQILVTWDFPDKPYFVYGGPYDFIYVKKDIVADRGHTKEPDIEHLGMERSDGNSVGYVEVALKYEGGRKVRLFYVHFPSFFTLSPDVINAAHIDAWDWIAKNIRFDIPCLIAGDFNNDFVRQYNDKSIPSAKHIYESVANLHLPILNPRLDGSGQYEGTHRPQEDPRYPSLGSTIDWVIGNEFVDGSLVTSEPDWWRGTSPLVLDHKPLYGKVVFSWEERPTAKWPFDPILVIDRSGSIQGVFGLMQGIENDAGTFVDQLLQRARQVAVINFSSRGDVHLDCRFSSDRARVLQAINNPSVTSGGTALYQAVDEALNASPAGGKTAVVVFSDGCENSSMISLEEAIRKAQERGVPVLTVGYIGDGGRNEDGLHQLAGSTRGFYERAEALDVEKMLNRFSDYLQYKKTIAPAGGAF